MSELQQCLFCGAEGDLNLDVCKTGDGEFYVECMECGAAGPICPSKEEAIEAWNVFPLNDAQGNGWINVEGKPPVSGKPYLVAYKNSLGHWRIVKAFFAAMHFIIADPDDDQVDLDYSEADDEYYLCSGWYELIDNHDEYSSFAIHRGKVAYYMPLPDLPEKEE